MFKEANSVAELKGENSIVVSRVFDAPRELVWDAWVNPEQRAQWWGPNGFKTTIESCDMREGGECLLTMHGPDGAVYPNKSVFTKVEKPETIAYNHGGHKQGGPGVAFKSTWTFEDIGGSRTKITMLQEFANFEARKVVVEQFHAVEGGKQTFDRLAEFVEHSRSAA
jgi:uncharacterized protein YndB with AHSA1/START domain